MVTPKPEIVYGLIPAGPDPTITNDRFINLALLAGGIERGIDNLWHPVEHGSRFLPDHWVSLEVTDE